MYLVENQFKKFKEQFRIFFLIFVLKRLLINKTLTFTDFKLAFKKSKAASLHNMMQI